MEILRFDPVLTPCSTPYLERGEESSVYSGTLVTSRKTLDLTDCRNGNRCTPTTCELDPDIVDSLTLKTHLIKVV